MKINPMISIYYFLDYVINVIVSIFVIPIDGKFNNLKF